MALFQPAASNAPTTFYDNYVPPLKDGTYTITLAQSLTVDGAVPVTGAPTIASATQQFQVYGPRFAPLPTADITQVFPPAGSTGSYANYLPQVVFNHPALPWERDLTLTPLNPALPWLALLVVADDELPPLPPGSTPSPTHTTTMGLSTVLMPNGSSGTILGPAVKETPPLDLTCNVIELPVALFNGLLPTLTDLPYLSHARQVSRQAKAADTSQDGWHSVLIANRFVVMPFGTQATRTNIAHVVSLEGFESYVSGAKPDSHYETVRMVSLYSWTYTTQEQPAEDFGQLMTHLLPASGNPADLLLRLPIPSTPTDTAVPDPAVRARLQAGYVPLSYAMLSGDQTFAWYRGPLSPVPVLPFLANTAAGQPANPLVPFSSADAMVYDPETGIFDQSYAVAFQTGRSLALASQSFAASLTRWRRAAHQAVDLLLEYMRSPVTASKLRQEKLLAANGDLTATGVADLAQLLDTNLVTAAFQDYFATTFYNDLAAGIGQRGGFAPTDTSTILAAAITQPSPTVPADLLSLMQMPVVARLLTHLAGFDDLGGLATALAPGSTTLVLAAPGLSEALPAHMAVAFNAPGSASIVLTAAAAAGATQLTIQAYTGTGPVPAASRLQTKAPSEDAVQVVEWLARTALLQGLPFNNLVAHPSLLPLESIRFFYLDPNWTDALLDGALSVGLRTSRDSLFQQLMRDKLYENVQGAMAEVRGALLGNSGSSAGPLPVQLSGFVLRSQSITSWPGLEVQAWAGGPTQVPMQPLRLDTLPGGVMLAIYPDVPVKLTFTEPSEGLVFGTEPPVGSDTGQVINLRYVPGTSGYTPANDGQVISGKSIAANDIPLRPSYGVVDVYKLVQMMQDPSYLGTTLGPAAFAVQMIRVPEQLVLLPPQP